MKLLEQLRPAQTIMLLDGNSAAIPKMMKLTFIDLLLKKVLITKEIVRAIDRDRFARAYTYVAAGPNFYHYKPLDFEKPILDPFRKSPLMGLLIRHVVKITYQGFYSRRQIRSFIIQSTPMQKYCSQNMLQDYLGRFSLRPEGISARQKLHSELEEASSFFRNSAGNNRQKAAEILGALGGHMLLLDGVDNTLIHTLSRQIDMTGATASSWNITGFDASWRSDWEGCTANSCSSGCGGDSGCSSGCSGCGSGCGGGCGGD
jgi:hypothetical protein